MNDLAPGDAVLLNDQSAEVIKTYAVGDLDYLRTYIENVGVKTVCTDDVNIEPKREQLGALDTAIAEQLHPDHDGVSAEWFDLRSKPSSFRSPTNRASCSVSQTRWFASNPINSPQSIGL